MKFDASHPPLGSVRDWLDARADTGGAAFMFPETNESLNWQDLRLSLIHI